MESFDLHLTFAKKFCKWQNDTINNVDVPKNERIFICCGLIELALDHEEAIILLLEAQLFGSAFALIRPLFEAYVRSVWLLRVATEEQLQQFKKGAIDQSLGNMISGIEKIPGYDVGALSQIKKQHWNLMNDFTHGGISQASSRYTSTDISPRYPHKDIIGVINFVFRIGALLMVEVASIVNIDNYYDNIENAIESFEAESRDIFPYV